MILRIICICLLFAGGILAALFFKNDEISPIGVVVAQNVSEEEQQIYFDDEMPNFAEEKDEKETEKNDNIKENDTKNGKKELATNDILININTAKISDLILLPGIGEATAQKIIDYRNEFGNFTEIEDLKKIKGIGDKKFESMKKFLIL